MGGWIGVGIVGLSLAGSLAGLAAAAPARSTAPAAPACRYNVVSSGRVVSVVDGRSFALEDGREVRLAGIETPPPNPGPGGNGPGAASAAKAALESLVLGRIVDLRQRQPANDRYGRIVALVSFPEGVSLSEGVSLPDGTQASPEAAAPSIAHALIGRGFARVGANLDDPACTTELLSRERVARTQRLGLWGEPDYAIVSADNGAELVGQEGRFAVVEGKVASVRESGGLIYMNFGRRWSQALTVTILKRHERSFAAAGLQPDRLANLRLRVRGYIEERSGPRIEATRPEQIEIAQGEIEKGK
jgi:endonuclease YncB( thermonuclease family)